MNSQTEFIQLPITDIIRDVINSSAGIGDGIETYPLCDYVMQSVFLKMTGFQEQKMKAVCWALASNDHEYRYAFTKNPLGECSRHEDKQDVYKGLVSQIIKRSQGFNASTGIDKIRILSDTSEQIKSVFEKKNLTVWVQRSFNEYEIIWEQVQVVHFASDDSTLFKANKSGFSLRKIYEDHLYRHRNRIAHNTQSYQQNLPTLKALLSDDFKYENYFVYFSMLVLIDNIIINLFNKYLTAHKEYAE